MVRPFKNVNPFIASDAFIAETAVIIGDVHIGSQSSIWYNVVIRGDVNSIRIGHRSNIQDLSLIHVTGKKDANNSGSPLFIGDDVTVGHHVTLHGCTIGNKAFIGMNVLIMDRVVIGESAMVAAGSLVPEGTSIPPGTLWMGSPARFKRVRTEAEKTKSLELAAAYVSLAKTFSEEIFPPA